jgi:hypothetical protein
MTPLFALRRPDDAFATTNPRTKSNLGDVCRPNNYSRHDS